MISLIVSKSTELIKFYCCWKLETPQVFLKSHVQSGKIMLPVVSQQYCLIQK